MPAAVGVAGAAARQKRSIARAADERALPRFAAHGIPFHALVTYRDLGIEPVKDV